MKRFRERMKEQVYQAVLRVAGSEGIDGTGLSQDQIIAERPPKPELGDVAFPMFPLAGVFRRAPQQIAELVENQLAKELLGNRIERAGAYINIFFDQTSVTGEVMSAVERAEDRYGRTGLFEGTKQMVEFSCPNTNKPLHLGHLRNDALGESVARILESCGAEVRKVNLINDRGIHICKSMLAYQAFGEGETPESTGRKSDHFVGDYYVRFNQWSAEDESAEEKARSMLRSWEEGDPEVVSLWKTMNQWAIDGISETYRRTGVSFDTYYYESRTYTRGREEVLKGLESGSFYREEDGSVWVDLSDIDLDKKVLLRSDGTSLYLTQDIGTAIARHEDWPFGRLVYVVASEQEYHFRVLFYVLEKLGFDWASSLHHLSYGMVNLPEGKMKSREGTVVDADDLLVQLREMALKEIGEKERDAEVADPVKTAEGIALAALHYYLLKVNPNRDMIFNPAESLSFNGDTGPYLQYVGARISSILRKAEKMYGPSGPQGVFKPDLLTVADEWELIKLLAEYPDFVNQAGEKLDPSIIAGYLFETAKAFSKYYHDNPILHNENPDIVVSRIRLVRAVLQVMKNGFHLLNIPFLDVM
ncbi:MAG: arginine--tRNA ligase [Spirochaetales bacterium]|nr:arginine--tRNA ligase [Spirochaetales bacterium]MCF7937983.1 arginine--tRNA ligase [Spirochaetales bacterium]